MYEVKKPLIPVSLKSVDNLKQDYKNILDWLQAKMIFLFYNPFSGHFEACFELTRCIPFNKEDLYHFEILRQLVLL